MTNAISTIESELTRASAELRAVLSDLGHPLVAADAFLKALDAYVIARYKAVEQEIRNVIP